MYNDQFIFEDCGFHWLPDHLDRHRLFNVSFNIHTGDIKLYLLSDDKRSLYKAFDHQIVQQDRVEDQKTMHKRLESFLDCSLNPAEIEVDTVENDTLYIFTEHASSRQFMRFLNAFMEKYCISKPDFLQAVSQINNPIPVSIADCWSQQLISGFKVPFSGQNCKIYSRPFKTGNLYDFNERTLEFLTRLYRCQASELRPYIQHMWVSIELFTGRIMVTTQYHQLVHQA
jgi:hypothetical protein